MTTTTPTSYTREVEIDRLVIDQRFAGLFIEDPAVVKRLAASMRRDGFDPHRAVDVWKDGDGRGRHVVLEGHQRLAAAQAAGLDSVRVAFRHPADATAALLWAAEQQTNRRNSSREAQCLSVLRALERADQLEGTRAELAERFGFGDATVGRALQVLRRGTESEALAVLEGTHSLKRAYELIKARERADNRVEPDEPPTPAPAATTPATEGHDDADDDELEPDDELRGWLGEMRDVLATLAEAVDQARDLYDSDLRHVVGSTAEHRNALNVDIWEAAKAVDELEVQAPAALRGKS